MFAALLSRSSCVPRYRHICGLMANCVRTSTTTSLPHMDPQKVLDEMATANISPDRSTYQKLIHQYCLQGNVIGATSLLEKMKESGMELNEAIFSALIIGYSKQESPPQMSEMFDLMRNSGIEPGSPSIVAALSVQADKLSRDPNATDELKTLCETIENEYIQFSVSQTIDLMKSFAPFRKDETVMRLINLLSRVMLGNLNARQQVCTALLEIGDYEEVSRLYWLYKPSERGLRSGSLGRYYARILGASKNTPIDHIMNECRRIKTEQRNPTIFHTLYYSAAESGNLELVRLSLKQIGQEEVLKCQYFWPLLAQSKSEEEMIQVLKNDLSPTMESQDLFDTFLLWVWPKFFGDIPRLIEANKELNYDNNILMASLLHYSINQGKIEDAIEFVKEASDGNDETSEERQYNRSGSNMGVSIDRLLMKIAEAAKDPSVVKKVFNVCQIKRVTNRTLNPLIKAHLLNEDFDGAFKEFMELFDKYGITPYKSDLMIYCLKNKRPQELQKIMNISIEKYGENNALHDLALCCIICGKEKQAQRIFSNPAFRVTPNRIYECFALLARKGNIDALEKYVRLARDIYDVDKERLYRLLIEAYDKTSNPKRALDFWNKTQEEEVELSKKTLLQIANLLERNNIEVPFEKPTLG